MKVTRTFVVVIAIVVGLVAAGLSYYFLNNAQKRAFDNARLVEAYVVSKPIPRGFSGAAAVNGGYFTVDKIPTETRPASALTSLAPISGQEAIAPFSVGQVLVSGMFVSPSQAEVTFSQAIPAGDVAVTVSLGQPQSVANLPVPGDKVDILVDSAGAENVLLQNVLILAIGQQTASTASNPSVTGASTGSSAANTSGLYTFAVSPSDAERIAFAQSENLGISLLLVPPNNPVVSGLPQWNEQNLFSGPQT